MNAREEFGLPYQRPATKRLVEGRGKYVADLSVKRMLTAAFLRSPHAKAGIRSIDISSARRQPGVAAVFTGTDLLAVCKGWQGNATIFPGLAAPTQYPLAVDFAGYAGEAVACVVAHDRASAEDALDHIKVDWDVQEATPLLEDALAAAPAHPELASNLGFQTTFGNGKIEDAFAAADLIVEDRFVFHRQTGAPLETRGLIADYDPAEQTLTVHHSHQVPHEIQTIFAGLLDIPQHRVRIICPDIGGGFGIKLHLYADEVAIAAISRIMGRPIKFIADRTESLATDVHAREHRIKARMAFASDGRILGLEADDLFGMGPYSTAPRTSISEAVLALRVLGAPYRFEHFRTSLRAVFQNRAPTGQYRAVGMPIGCTVTERLLDHGAQKLGIDPAEIRRRNLVPADAQPTVSASGMPLFELSQHECLEKLLRLMNWSDLKVERDQLRRQGIYRGIGLAAFVEPTGPGSETNGRGGLPVVASESVQIKLEPSGSIRCLIGVSELGQGITAGVAQVVAASVGVAVEEVSVLVGDTAAVPVGGGAWASRGMVVGGEAAWQAGRLLRDQILGAAASLLQYKPEQLDIVAGSVVTLRGQDSRLSLREIAETVYYRNYLLPPGLTPQLAISHHYRRQQHPFVPTNGVQASYVELDPELGKVRLLRHWVVDDCGRIINPLLVDEQIRGGVVQGIGPALFEACRYDEGGKLISNTLFDYLPPMAPDIPDIEIGHVETPYSGSDLGAKGAGEAGTGAAGAAVLNAVNDALIPFGVSVTTTPMTPAVILDALNKRRH